MNITDISTPDQPVLRMYWQNGALVIEKHSLYLTLAGIAFNSASGESVRELRDRIEFDIIPELLAGRFYLDRGQTQTLLMTTRPQDVTEQWIEFQQSYLPTLDGPLR